MSCRSSFSISGSSLTPLLPLSRDEKRHQEKKNKSERAKKKKEDIARTRELVDLALSLDPRIKAFKAAEKAARAAKKGGPAVVDTKKLEEEKKAAEEAAAAKAAEDQKQAADDKVRASGIEGSTNDLLMIPFFSSISSSVLPFLPRRLPSPPFLARFSPHQASREAAKKAREAAKKNVKKDKKAITALVTANNYFVAAGSAPSASVVEGQFTELDVIFEKLEPEQIGELKKQAEAAKGPDAIKAVIVAFAKKVEGGNFVQFA